MPTVLRQAQHGVGACDKTLRLGEFQPDARRYYRGPPAVGRRLDTSPALVYVRPATGTLSLEVLTTARAAISAWTKQRVNP